MIAPYVARNRRNTMFRGPLKGLQKYSSFSDRKFSAVVQLMGIYTLYYADRLLEAQEEKFLKSVETDDPPIDHDICETIERASYILIPCSKLPKPSSILDLPISPSKREPRIDGSSSPEGEETLDIAWEWLNQLYERKEESVIPLRKLCYDVLADVQGGWGYWKRNVPPLVGRIGFIQEPGLKLRAVANPSRLIQAAIRPLGLYLYEQMKILPWDCTHDQSKAFPFIQERLRDHHVVHSVDLTDASNFFPLDLQRIVLEKVFPNDPDYVDAFLYACTGLWLYKNRFGECRGLRWNRGQPLGLFPSFPSAFLTHGLLLFGLNNNKHEGKFFVLGDDVVILDDGLHDKYRNTMMRLCCPISESKSLSSNLLAEFAGKIVLPNMIVPQLKWRNPSDDSFIDFVRNFGLRAVRLLRPRQRAIALSMVEVPSFMGGLGFNPRGIPLAERVFNALCALKEGVDDSFLMSYNRLVNKLIYTHKPFWTELFIRPTDFDLKSIALVLRCLPREEIHFSLYGALGLNLFHIDPDLPLRIGGSDTHRSLLEKLEQRLR